MIDKKKLIEELLDCVANATDTETQITNLTMAGMLINDSQFIMDLEEIKQKTAIIFNTKDIENIEDILSYDDLGKNIKEVLIAIREL